ncbi:histone-lysine N-methyltransferase NSD2-like isoform X2 [Gordionus sp. m RMFG-2023]|uniref:histone-lysine N-methyltransferase NSD2-like isoform X2 n=1 Tax=Gordionus sp. m RMFG-2023 TaxID=3053472 RepID=UPI0031FBA9DD
MPQKLFGGYLSSNRHTNNLFSNSNKPDDNINPNLNIIKSFNCPDDKGDNKIDRSLSNKNKFIENNNLDFNGYGNYNSDCKSNEHFQNSIDTDYLAHDIKPRLKGRPKSNKKISDNPKNLPKVVLYNVFNDRSLLKKVSVNFDNEITDDINEATNQNNDIPCNWLVGDLIWAKLSTYPWWPSMIIYDPSLGIFTRTKKKNREYHVQFFGENARAWVYDKNILAFDKPLSYQDILTVVDKSNPKALQKSTKSFNNTHKRVKTKQFQLENLDDFDNKGPHFNKGGDEGLIKQDNKKGKDDDTTTNDIKNEVLNQPMEIDLNKPLFDKSSSEIISKASSDDLFVSQENNHKNITPNENNTEFKNNGKADLDNEIKDDMPSTSSQYHLNGLLSGDNKLTTISTLNDDYELSTLLSEGVPTKFRSLWSLGLEIAERALPLNRMERRQTLTIDFPSPNRYKKHEGISSQIDFYHDSSYCDTKAPLFNDSQNSISYKGTTLYNKSDINGGKKVRKYRKPNSKKSGDIDYNGFDAMPPLLINSNNITIRKNIENHHFDIGEKLISGNSENCSTEMSKSLNSRESRLQNSNFADYSYNSNINDSISSFNENSASSKKRARKLSSKLVEYNLLPLPKKLSFNSPKKAEQGITDPFKTRSTVQEEHINIKIDNASLTNKPIENKAGIIDPKLNSDLNITTEDTKESMDIKAKSLAETSISQINLNIKKEDLMEVINNEIVEIKKMEADLFQQPFASLTRNDHKSEKNHEKHLKLSSNVSYKKNSHNSSHRTPNKSAELKKAYLSNTGDAPLIIRAGPLNPISLSPSSTVKEPVSSTTNTNNQKENQSKAIPFNNDKYYICLLCKMIEPAFNSCSNYDNEDSMVKCVSKNCSNTYHRKCLGFCSTTPSDTYLCDECTSGKHPCFVCKNYDTEAQPCMLASCGKYYHKQCISRYPLTVVDTNGLVCPRHQCATCISENSKNPRATKGRFYNCILCPCTYHSTKECLAAGSFILSDNSIICSDHNQPENHLNVGWCFICSKGEGNDLFCCDSCPAAFHKSCLPGVQIPSEGLWWCPDCESGKRPVVGDVLWVKLSSYRWWPGRVCNPQAVPYKVRIKAGGDSLSDLPGQFPVYFFGSGDYYWINRTRVFLFADGDTSATKESSSSQGKSLNKTFAKALQEAAEEFEIRKTRKLEKLKLEQNKMASKKFRPFKMIKCNKPIPSSTSSTSISNSKDSYLNLEPHILLRDLHACNCDPNQPQPCSEDNLCLNRISLIECHPKVCKAGDRCHNQRFVKREYPSAKPYLTKDNRGWGLMTLVDIKKGDFVNEYVGELIDETECRRRIEIAYKNNLDDFYFLTLDKDRIIDAGPKGNLSRFMNHNCEPNLETQKWTVNGDIRVGLFAIKDIPEGSELTFNYNLDCLGNEKKKCKCGATNCSRFMGVRPPKKVPEKVSLVSTITNSNSTSKISSSQVGRKISSRNSTASSKKIKPKSLDDPQNIMEKLGINNSKVVPKVLDEECFVCGDVGELISCDRATCTKVYHVTCVQLSSVPAQGKWTCPRHFCSIENCTTSDQITSCHECTISFCPEHLASGKNMIIATDIPNNEENRNGDLIPIEHSSTSTNIILCSTAEDRHNVYIQGLLDFRKMEIKKLTKPLDPPTS